MGSSIVEIESSKLARRRPDSPCQWQFRLARQVRTLGHAASQSCMKSVTVPQCAAANRAVASALSKLSREHRTCVCAARAADKFHLHSYDSSAGVNFEFSLLSLSSLPAQPTLRTMKATAGLVQARITFSSSYSSSSSPTPTPTPSHWQVCQHDTQST